MDDSYLARNEQISNSFAIKCPITEMQRDQWPNESLKRMEVPVQDVGVEVEQEEGLGKQEMEMKEGKFWNGGSQEMKWRLEEA